MGAIIVVLAILLVASVGMNAYQRYVWNSYRNQPAGAHSHTGMFPAIKVE
jgi:Tfp pilus assembly protein PilE